MVVRATVTTIATMAVRTTVATEMMKGGISKDWGVIFGFAFFP